ncbi:MAG: type I glyceraldehyde-3-phosphate dehydrogenase [Legionellales bacterium]|nr:type I glyceraldehyde-3-phosphate dehydrogenase [Legionellales bacterium]|tara:strand:- start:962 stop:1990 length:1029 start_codon:yes stop_codon:yes gene_type:complete
MRLKKRVAINGFGRIGRVLTRIYLENPSRFDFDLVGINTPGDADSVLYLLKYDSTHGVFKPPVILNGNQLVCGNQSIQLYSERELPKRFWSDQQVDYVLDCSGLCRDKASAIKHLDAGARKVLLASPAKGVDRTVVYGVNHNEMLPDDQVISCASCTTNCLAPIAFALNQMFQIESGFMTTVHAYTNDQALIDRRHKDYRRGRAAAESIIPTSTGAASSIGEVLPQLAGRLSGNALRIPTGNVSLLDLSVTLGKPVDASQVIDCFKQYAEGHLKGIIALNDQPLVSVDFLQHEASAIVDATQIYAREAMLKMSAWYDNEWGYACRMLDVTQYLQTQVETSHV